MGKIRCERTERDCMVISELFGCEKALVKSQGEVRSAKTLARLDVLRDVLLMLDIPMTQVECRKMISTMISREP